MTINTNTAVIPYGFEEKILSDLNQEGMGHFADSKPPKDSLQFLGYLVPSRHPCYGPSGHFLEERHHSGTHIDIYI